MKPVSVAKLPEPIAILRAINAERLAGTSGEYAAAEKIQDWVESLGFSVTRHPFSIRTFYPKKSTFTLAGKTVEVIPFGCCKTQKVKAEMLYVENPRSVNLAPEYVRGKIILTYGRPAGIYRELKNAGIAGMLTISPPYKGAQSLSHRQFEKNVLPAATIDYDDAAVLSRFSGEIGVLQLNQTPEDATAYNLEVKIPGTQTDGSITYCVGHYDTVSRSPGACDNGGGVAVLLHLLRYFAQHPPRRDVRMIFFSGEELGLRGSLAYAKENAEEIAAHARMVINVDVTGDDLGTDELYITGTPEMLGFMQGVARMNGIATCNHLSHYSSDSIPFAFYEVPSVNVARYGGKASFFGHTPKDALSRVTNYGLRRTLKLTIALAQALLYGAYLPVDKRIDSVLRHDLEQYWFNLTGEEPAFRWEPAYLRPAGK